jgi:hypothetical protein
MKNIERCNLKYKAFSIDLNDVYKDIKNLGQNNELSIYSRYWDNYKFYAEEFIDKVYHYLRHVYVNKSNVQLLEQIKSRKFYLKTLIIDYSCLTHLSMLLNQDITTDISKWNDTQSTMIDNIVIVIENKFTEAKDSKYISKVSSNFPFSLISTKILEPSMPIWE